MKPSFNELPKEVQKEIKIKYPAVSSVSKIIDGVVGEVRIPLSNGKECGLSPVPLKNNSEYLVDYCKERDVLVFKNILNSSF